MERTKDDAVKESCKIAIRAIKKQIPAKPKHVIVKHGKHDWTSGMISDLYCRNCGKRYCEELDPESKLNSPCVEERDVCPSCGVELYRSGDKEFCSCGQRISYVKGAWK